MDHHDLPVRRRRPSPPPPPRPFNPIIVLRRRSGQGGVFEFFYDDGASSSLRSLPASISEFLMSSGVERLLEQLTQFDFPGGGDEARRRGNPPASKVAVESMPTIAIADTHLCIEAHCAVCMEPFQLGLFVREMPCKHIYHQDCILPWLSLRNSCPVCRLEMPAEERGLIGEDDEVGLTIWRLPGGGFAVGRFSGRRSAGETGLPLVFTEMDGVGPTAGGSGDHRSRIGRSRASRRIGSAFRNILFLLGLRRRSSSSLWSRSSAL